MQNTPQTQRKRSALGQGLSALIPLSKSAFHDDRNAVVSLPIDSLEPNAFQPRRSFSASALDELAASIKEMGVIQPIVVRPNAGGAYQIVAGERRWRAAKLAGYSMIPAIVKDLSDQESLEIALIENVQREDLNALDVAEAYDTLLKRFSYTQETLAKKIGKERSSITNYLRLLRLPDPVKNLLREEQITFGHAKALLSLEDATAQLSISLKVAKRKISVRELEKIVANYKNRQTLSAPSASRRSSASDLELGLSRFLATKVVVKQQRDSSGKLEIFFHNEAELVRLLDLMGYSADFS